MTDASPAERDGSQPLRVVLVSNGFPPIGHWGTEFYTHQLAVGLQARGHTVTVLCPRRDGTQPRYTLERRVEDGIEVVEVHNAGDPRKRFEDSWRNACPPWHAKRGVRPLRPSRTMVSCAIAVSSAIG